MSKKANILFTIPNFKTAGSQFVLLSIYKMLNRDFFQPFVLVEKFPEIFPEMIPENERLFIEQEGSNLKSIKSLSKLLRNKKIDILHSWDYKSNSIEALACRKTGVKYIYTKKNNAWSKRWRIKSFLSHHIAYNNPEMLSRFFSNTLLKRKTSFVPHGVDTDVFKHKIEKISGNHFVIGCVGNVNDNKNQLFVIKALAKLPLNVHFEVYGNEEVEYKKQLIHFIKEYSLAKRVTFHGFLENNKMPSVLSSFDVLVLASKNEGLPLCLIEAMACGVPILSSDSGGGARYIVGNNEGGFVYQNEAEFVEKVQEMVDNENGILKQLSEGGQRRVAEKFSLKEEVKMYQEIYRKLVN